MINRTCTTRKQALDAFEHGDTLRRTFYGTSGSVAAETTFVVDIHPRGMVYDDFRGYAHATSGEVVFDGRYRAPITLEQVYAYIDRQYAPDSIKVEMSELDANMGVCPTPTIEEDA